MKNNRTYKNFFNINVLSLFVTFLTLYPNLQLNAQNGLNLLKDEAYFKQQLKYNPNNADLHYDLATVYKRMGNLSEAQREYKQAVFFNPNDSEAICELAILYRLQSNKLQLAEVLLKKCLGINPKDDIAWKELAFIQSDLCRSEEAINSLKKSLEFDDSIENTKFILLYISVLQLNLRKKAEALQTAEQLSKFDVNLANQVKELADMQ